jgi:hypothetical protein
MKKVGPYSLIKSSLIYKNPWISLREDEVIFPKGKKGIFGVVTMKPGSSIVAIDDEMQIYLIKEYKYGVKRESLELISGAIDLGETPLAAAKRELKEETGLTARKWTKLGCVDPFTTIINSPNHIFLAQNLKAGSAQPEDGEVLILVRMKFTDSISMVMKGQITHAASCVGILKAAKIIGI